MHFDQVVATYKIDVHYGYIIVRLATLHTSYYVQTDFFNTKDPYDKVRFNPFLFSKE
jgi:hypothetical protein